VERSRLSLGGTLTAALLLAMMPKSAPAAPVAKAKAPGRPVSVLREPSKADLTAPATFKVRVEATCGVFTLAVTRSWAPKGADRFYSLVKAGFYDDAAFFRVVPGFVVQFGLNGDPAVSSAWRQATIPDDPVTQSNKRGAVTFATGGPNTRTTQVFINLADNPRLDRMGFAVFGAVVEGIDVVDKISSAHGEAPQQGLLQAEGNGYLRASFPRLDYIKKATVVP
jgi:peptidyl-prolyl cis-trans isomerase A (cyclophilin A)